MIDIKKDEIVSTEYVLFKTYIRFVRQGKINLPLSPRIPDFAIKYWLEQLERAVKASTHNSFIDIGAGGGRLTLLLGKTYFKTGTAIEIGVNRENWRKVLEELPTVRLVEDHLQQGIEEELAQSKKYDFVLLSEVFEHIPEPDVPNVLIGLNGLLAVGGKLFLTTPNYTFQGPASESDLWYERVPYGHYKHYQFDELKEIAEKFGFKVIWNCYEGYGHLLRNAYGTIYYFLVGLDHKFLVKLSLLNQIPKTVKVFLETITLPFSFVLSGLFWQASRLVVWAERNFNSEEKSSTVMVFLEKVADSKRELT